MRMTRWRSTTPPRRGRSTSASPTRPTAAPGPSRSARRRPTFQPAGQRLPPITKKGKHSDEPSTPHPSQAAVRLGVIAVALSAPAAGAGAADAATLAVDAAQPGDTVKVCAGNYAEQVTVAKPLTLTGDPDAVEALDCYQPSASTLGDLDPTRQAIVDPPADGYSIAFRLQADEIVVEGLAIERASVGIDAGDRHSGYRIDHNLLRRNTLFAIDLGSEGTQQSRVDHNCLR